MKTVKKTNSKQVRIALAGFGVWGKNWARVLYQLGHLEAIFDTDPLVIESARPEYKKAGLTTRYSDLLKNPRVQAIVIASPASTHKALAFEALAAGKHVMIEKPLALHAAEGKEILDLAAKHKRMVMVGHILEYHPAITELKQLLKSGELGKIRYVYSNRLNIGRIRTEENALWSFAPHDIAVILRLLGRMPVEVECRGEAYLSGGVADTTLTHLKFADKVQAHIFVSWLHPFKEQRLVVVGEEKMAVFDDAADWPDKLVLYPHRIEWKHGTVPTAMKAQGIKVPLDRAEPLVAECKHFVECIRRGAKPLTDGESGLRVLEVLERAQASLMDKDSPRLKDKEPALSSGVARDGIHPTAIVDEGASVGKGTRIWHFCHVCSGARIGDNCNIGQNAFIASGARIGNGVKIQNNVSIYEAVTLEDHVFCGPSMVFTNVKIPRSEICRKHELGATLVRRGATLGANCTIVCGTTIGGYAFVGAGAVVTKDVPDYAMVTGSPARIRGWSCECGVRLSFEAGDALCASCGREYRRVSDEEIKKVIHENTAIRPQTAD